MAAFIWTKLVEWFWSRTRQFWVTMAFGAACFAAGGCACHEWNVMRPHWFF